MLRDKISHVISRLDFEVVINKKCNRVLHIHLFIQFYSFEKLFLTPLQTIKIKKKRLDTFVPFESEAAKVSNILYQCLGPTWVVDGLCYDKVHFSSSLKLPGCRKVLFVSGFRFRVYQSLEFVKGQSWAFPQQRSKVP